MCYLVCGFVDLANVLENALSERKGIFGRLQTPRLDCKNTTRTFIKTFSENEYGVHRQRELRKLLGTCQFASK